MHLGGRTEFSEPNPSLRILSLYRMGGLASSPGARARTRTLALVAWAGAREGGRGGECGRRGVTV